MEVPVYVLVHSLQELQTYYLNEIQRAMCGLGQYRLRKEFSHYQQPADECISIPVSCPDDIMKNLQIQTQEEMLEVSMAISPRIHTLLLHTYVQHTPCMQIALCIIVCVCVCRQHGHKLKGLTPTLLALSMKRKSKMRMSPLRSNKECLYKSARQGRP